MNIVKNAILLSGIFIILQPYNCFPISIKVIGEYEKSGERDSILNPDNLLNRTVERGEGVILLEGIREILGGEGVAVLRGDAQYLKAPYSSSDTEYQGQINELYYQRDVNNWTITLGRKKLRLGVGYSWSPTDIITRIREASDPEDRLYHVEGTDLIKLSRIKGNGQYDLIYFPKVILEEKRLDQNRFGFRYYHYMEPVDLSLVGKLEESGRWAAGINGSLTRGEALELHGEYLYNTASDTLYPAYKENPKQFYLYFPYYRKNIGSHNLLIGGQYTMKNYWNITLEYLYNSEGYSQDEWDAYIEHIRFLNQSYREGENYGLAISGLKSAASVYRLPLRDHYFFARLYKENIFTSISLEWLNFIGLSDMSGFQIIQIQYTGFEKYNIYLRLQKPWGGASTEFGLIPEDFKGIIGIFIFIG
ncbi:MAG: hypothetical protein HY097_00845 [Nitrospinae bacterium]|nr:hypothetical protein [Nitrospinota bacterium]MBI3815342.1 hypothetical protein [Nitrospinota bacterium]